MEPVGGVLGVQGSGEVFGTMVEGTRTVLRGDGFAWRAGCHDRRRIGCRVLFSVRHDAVFPPDRKSTRLNSSHGYISYAVFCLKKKKNTMSNSPQQRPASTPGTDRIY